MKGNIIINKNENKNNEIKNRINKEIEEVSLWKKKQNL